jgi:methanogenic corrinoid protein MtbC1
MAAKSMDAEAQIAGMTMTRQGGARECASEPMSLGTALRGDASPPIIAKLPGGARQLKASEHRRVALLAHTLENEVIPRLVLARREATPPAYIDNASGMAPSAEDVAVLTALAQQGDLSGSLAYIGGLRSRGMPLERVYLGLLAPVARRLGEMWEQDACDFTAVTVGLCCLQQVVLEHSSGFQPRFGKREVERRILLAPVPGEQHSFGLLMVGEFFRRQGWDVCSGTGATAREIVALVRKEWFALVGFSLSCDSRLDTLASAIRDIRRASRNPQIGVLVGGKVFVDQPELATLVGADATAADGQQAALKAETLLALLTRED